MLPKKILLAEDDIDDQAFLTEFIASRKELHLLPIAENGEEALDFLYRIQEERDLPDIIILDQNMPRLNGLQTLNFLKGNKAYAHIPVIVYTTNPDEKLRQRSISAGAAMVFPKPYTPEGYGKLVDVLVDLIEDLS